MSKMTMALGGALILLGILGFSLANGTAITALIPAFFGLPLLALGGVALVNETMRRHVMHGAAALALLGFLGTVPAWRFGLYMLSVGTRHVERPMAVIMQSIMALLCGVYLYFSIRSFVEARRNKAI